MVTVDPLTTPIDDEHLKEVCRIGQGAECCRYLTMAGGKDPGWSCEKRGGLKATIDERVANGLFTACGDNCEGRLCRR